MYKTRQEVLRAAADWMDVCDAAGVEARCMYEGKRHMVKNCEFIRSPGAYKFPLGLIDGKEVWEGVMVELKEEDVRVLVGDPLITYDEAIRILRNLRESLEQPK